MAFVRWRGNRAQLLTTRYDKGRSRQICVANLQNGYFVPEWIKADVKQRHPQVKVDWAAVDRALAEGPPGSPPLTQGERQYAEVEQALRQWADESPIPSEARILRLAAQLVTNQRARESRNETR